MSKETIYTNIDDNFRLRHTPLNFILERYADVEIRVDRKPTGEFRKEWVELGSYSVSKMMKDLRYGLLREMKEHGYFPDELLKWQEYLDKLFDTFDRLTGENLNEGK